jgi:hypothetical protein
LKKTDKGYYIEVRGGNEKERKAEAKNNNELLLLENNQSRL